MFDHNSILIGGLGPYIHYRVFSRIRRFFRPKKSLILLDTPGKQD